MSKYLLLFMMLGALAISRILATQVQGGLCFSGNEKLIINKNSVLRKLLLKKDNQDYPLKIYKVIPFVINVVLCCAILVVYIFYVAFFTFPFGIAVGRFLDNTIVQLSATSWCLLNYVYTAIITVI